MSATELSSPPPPSNEPDKPSWWKRKLWKFPVWAWLVGAFIVLGAIINLTEKDKEDDAASSASPTASVPSTTPTTSEPLTTSTASAPPTTTTSTSPPTTEASSAPVPVMVAWGQVHGDLVRTTSDEMNKVTAALKDFDLPEAERSSRVVSGNMTVLAKSLENESDPGAVASRNAFNSCAVAYGAAAQAISDVDTEAVSAATTLIQECTSAMRSATEAIGAG